MKEKKDILVRGNWHVRKSEKKWVEEAVKCQVFNSESEYIRYLINRDKKNYVQSNKSK